MEEGMKDEFCGLPAAHLLSVSLSLLSAFILFICGLNDSTPDLPRATLME